MKENQFFAMMSRMKYINRWGLMRNTYNENICEHSLQVAMIAHALGVIGNTYFNKNINSDRLAIMGMYHDSTEIITGDNATFTVNSESFAVLKFKYATILRPFISGKFFSN